MNMKQIATTLLSSKKFLALLVTLLVLVATRKLGLDEATATELAREIVALAAADHGKEAAKVTAKATAEA